MTSKNRFVTDTNVLISFLLFFDSVPGQAVRKALSTGVLLRSKATLFELARILERSKFDNYVTLEERRAFLTGLVRESLPGHSPKISAKTDLPTREAASAKAWCKPWRPCRHCERSEAIQDGDFASLVCFVGFASSQ